MKKIYFLLFQTRFFALSVIILFCCSTGFSQTTYTWNQTGTADWTVATNWTPTRTTPAPNDILIFNNSATNTPINIPTQTIGQLSITTNTTVNLQGGAAGAVLTISGLTGIDLVVASGSVLNINGTNALTITVATGATGSITGNMSFTNADHRLDAADALGITFNSPAVFTQGTGCTGSVFTTTGTDDAIVFSSGSTFNQLDGANPFAKIQPASKVVFNTGSLFHFQVPSGTPSFSGRTYADLQFSGSGTAASPTGTAVVSIDNLTITTGTLNFNVTGTPGHSIKGNISVALGATLNFSPASAGTVNLNGTSAQSITNNGTLTFGANHTLVVNNASGVTLNSPVTLSNQLTMTNGNLTIGNNDLIVGTISGGSSTSYIVTNGSGKLTRQNVSSLVLFPIGTTTTFNPLTIGNGTNPSTLNYTVKVDVGFTASIIANANLAINRTWYVTSSATPTGTVLIGFYYTGTPATDAGSLFTVAPATVDHGIFLPLGYGWNVNQTGLTQTPFGGSMYVASTTVSSFLGSFDFPMVIGNLGAILSAPRLVELSAQKINNTAQLSWTNNTNTTFKEMVIERSSNGRTFETLANVSTAASSYTDNNLLAGTNYYRIKLTDINGRVSYTAVAAIINGTTGFDVVGLLPNIVTATAQLNVTAAKKTQLNVVVTDMAGRPVLKRLFTAVAGSNLFTVNAAALSPGMYSITAVTNEGQSKTLRFVKQ